MDPPSNLDAVSVTKGKSAQALKPFTGEALGRDVVRGQYIAGTSDGQAVRYLEEEGANTQSQTETFVAMKTEVSNWRWAGVPFYLRTGKRMPEKLYRHSFPSATAPSLIRTSAASPPTS